jgi:hypothetical protein
VVRIPAGGRNSSLWHTFQTSGRRGFFLGDKATEREAVHVSGCSAEVKMCGAVPLLHHMPSWRDSQLNRGIILSLT